MKQKLQDALPIGYALVALLAGAVAYRACQTGRGYGDSPENAWFASFGTFVMAFVIFIVVHEAICPRQSLVVTISLLVVGTLVHLFAF